jgi:hypothetical protein
VAERRDLQAGLVLAPSPAQRDAAADLAAFAACRLADARAETQRAGRHLGDLESAPRRRRNPQGLEMARRTLAAATQEVASRSHELARAEGRSAALDQDLTAHAPLEERLAVVEGALRTQVERAVDTPAPYLQRILGPEPVDAAARSSWRAAARAMEVYRHEKLGLGPEAGPLSEEGLPHALGPRPQDHLAAQGWDAARLAVSTEASLDDLDLPSPQAPALEH